MTSTNTFTGMDQGSRNSSRVLAPPGGGSSNIFGDSAPAPAKQPPKPRPAAQQDNILGQPQAQPAARNVQAAPKQGENSFTTLFGPVSPSVNVKTTPSKGFIREDDNNTPLSSRPNSARKSQDTFKNVFGDPDHKVVPRTPKGRDDSFSRVFTGQECAPAPPPKPYKGIESLSLSNANHTKRNESPRSTAKPSSMDSSFCRVFGDFQGDSKPPTPKHLPDPRAFNPITGEPYGAPPAKTGAAETKVESKDEKETETSNGSGKDETDVSPAPAAYNAPKEHTSTRVLNPPGGRSTKLW